LTFSPCCTTTIDIFPQLEHDSVNRIFLVLVTLALAIPGIAQQATSTDQLAHSNKLKDAIIRGDALIAASQKELPPYHLHLDLIAIGGDGKTTNGTYDYWFVDPQNHRFRLVMGTYYRDTTVVRVAESYHSAGFEPLRIDEFFWYWRSPYGVKDEMTDQAFLPRMSRNKTKAGDELCAQTIYSKLCVDAAKGFYLQAQEGNLTALYDKWTPVGSRFVPLDLTLYHKKKLILHAIGSLGPVGDSATLLDVTKQTYPSPPEIDPPTPKTLRCVHSVADLYGYAKVHLWIDDKGNISRLQLMDSDEKALDGFAVRTAQTCKFMPAEIKGSTVPSETTYLYATWGQ
jgi:hypothetical protein